MMSRLQFRREFLQRTGLSAAAFPFFAHLPSLGFANSKVQTSKKRLVFIFSPNGVIPEHFWPDPKASELELKRILEPFAPFKERLLTVHGIDNKIKGDGDGHMRGIGCLLTGKELFPGDVQGGSDTPAGWCQGISVDQFLKNQLQADPLTQTRFGSLEFGLMVPERADTWTRMSYAGPNQPVAPIDNPYEMFNKLFGRTKSRAMLASVLDGVVDDLRRVEKMVSSEDRQLLNQHLSMVREVEKELQSELSQVDKQTVGHAIPELPPNVEEKNDNMPEISRMQIELLVSSFAADLARIATYQITNSVGQPKMKWLNISESHHELSHEPDSNQEAFEKLIKINTWYAEQVALLAKRLSETPEPGGQGSLLDNTTLVWTNELGKGNSHTRDNIPFVMVGGNLGFAKGRALNFKGVAHNRLLMTFCEAMGFPQKSFGNADYCGDGPLSLT
jgi:Protein of unknown function (DUF1552)